MVNRSCLGLICAWSAVASIAAADSIDFGWGDVFGLEAPVLRDHLQTAYGLEGLGGLDDSFGERVGYGPGFAFDNPGGDPVYFMVRAGSPFETDGIRWQELVRVATDDEGNPRWGEPTARLVVLRPADLEVDLDTYRHVMEEVSRTPARPATRVIAYALLGADLPNGNRVDGRGRVFRYRLLGEGHRVSRTLHEPDLGDPAAARYVTDTFWPRGIDGIGVGVYEDDTYDVDGLDFERFHTSLWWDEQIDHHEWVGYAVNLVAEGEHRDLSAQGTFLTFSVAGVTGDPDGAPYLYVVLEDAHGDPLGNEAHLAIDIGEITSQEQRVSLPLARFEAENPALDLTNLRNLKFAVRDGNILGDPYCRTGSVSIFDTAFLVASSNRLSAQNVFWSNDPVRQADPSHPLSDRFLGQPTSTFKYFHGIVGTDAAQAGAILESIAAIHAVDLTPHITLEMWPEEDGDVLSDLVAGRYDSFLEALFAGIAQTGGRVEIAPLHEANGWWYPWSGFGEPARVRDAFVHMGRVREAVGAHNVAVIYCIIAVPGTPGALRDAIEAYPGSPAVQGVGLQGFESGYGWDSVTFNEIFTTTASLLTQCAVDAPISVTEYGFSPAEDAQYTKGDLATWALMDVLDLRMPVPPVNMMYFNVAKQENGAWRDWRLYDSDGIPVPEIAPYIENLESLAGRDPLSTSPLGRSGYEQRLREHSRMIFAVDRGRKRPAPTDRSRR